MAGLRGVPKLRIHPQKKELPNPCTGELLAMLSCWASSRDLSHEGNCRDVVAALHDCMAKQTLGKRRQRPTINYHLARLSRNVKK